MSAHTGSSMGRRPVWFHSRREPSGTVRPITAAAVAYQCHRLFGESAQTWEQRLSQDYKRIALMNGVMRQMGALDLLTEKNAPVVLSLGADVRPEAEYRERLTDAAEDCAQAEYERNPCAETARELIRARARMRAAAEDHDREIAERYGLTP